MIIPVSYHVYFLDKGNCDVFDMEVKTQHAVEALMTAAIVGEQKLGFEVMQNEVWEARIVRVEHKEGTREDL